MSRNQLNPEHQAKLTSDELDEYDALYDEREALFRRLRAIQARRAALEKKAMGMGYRFRLSGEPT